MYQCDSREGAGNTVRAGGTLLPFCQNCSPSCNIKIEIPVSVPGNTQKTPCHCITQQDVSTARLGSVFGKYLDRTLARTPTRPILRFFVVFLSLQYLNLGPTYFLYILHNSTFTYHPTIYGYSLGVYKYRTRDIPAD